MSEISVASILEAARAQFVRTGVRRTSGDDIARSAGINRATLYRRVGTKDEIVRHLPTVLSVDVLEPAARG